MFGIATSQRFDITTRLLAGPTPRFGSMKNVYVTALAVLALLTISCSKTKFTAYRGHAIVDGKGGTVRVVDGIDFWENGQPDRKYRILGVIDDFRGEGLFVPRKDPAIAKIARENGGDGVILVGSSRELSGIDVNTGIAHHRRITKVLVVKYIP